MFGKQVTEEVIQHHKYNQTSQTVETICSKYYHIWFISKYCGSLSLCVCVSHSPTADEKAVPAHLEYTPVKSGYCWSLWTKVL